MPNLPYQTAGWDTHREVKLREIDYPLEGEPTHFTVRRTYEGPAATYASLALDTPDAEFPSAVFVRQGPLIDVDGGCVRYERLFATIPAQWSDPESFAYTFPALTAGTAGSSASVTSIGGGGTNEVIIGTTLAVSIGDNVSASVTYTRAGVVYNQSFSGPVLATNAGVSVTVSGNLLGSAGAPSGVSGSIREVPVGRESVKPMVADSRVQHDYALSSAADLPTDLPLFQPFRATTSLGVETDTLTATTSPTNTEYFDLVNSNGEIVAECWRGRYMGNIYVRRTRYVIAQ